MKTELRDTLEYNVNSLLGSEISAQLNKSIIRRKEFLIGKLESLGFIFRVWKDEYGKIRSVSKKGIKNAYVTFTEEGHGFRQAESIQQAIEAELEVYLDVFN